MILQAVVGGFVLDALFGDPAPAGGHLSGHEPCVSGGGKAQPVAGPCGADVLVRAGAGGKGPCAGEHKCV